MGEGPERGRVKIGKYFEKNFITQLRLVSTALLFKNKYSTLSIFYVVIISTCLQRSAALLRKSFLAIKVGNYSDGFYPKFRYLCSS